MSDCGWRMCDGGWRMCDGGLRMSDCGWWMSDGGLWKSDCGCRYADRGMLDVGSMKKKIELSVTITDLNLYEHFHYSLFEIDGNDSALTKY